MRDLPCFEYRTTVVMELYRGRCPDCGIQREKVEQLPSKAPFSKRLEEAIGEACESAPVRRVARRLGLAASTVRGIDLRYLTRWAAGRRKPALRQMGIDEIHLGKKQKFLTVVSNLVTGEPLWFGRERKKETLDKFFQEQLSSFQRSAIQAACVDMWEPFRQSLEQRVPKCQIVYDKFHILQHAGAAVDEVRRAEFFRKGGAAREVVKGKRWLPVALAAAEAHGEAGAHIARPSGRELNYCRILPNQGAVRRGGSRQRKHQGALTSWPRLPRYELPVAQGATVGRHQDPISRPSESRIECALCQILVQNPNYSNANYQPSPASTGPSSRSLTGVFAVTAFMLRAASQ